MSKQISCPDFYKHYCNQTKGYPNFGLTAGEYRKILIDLNKTIAFYITHDNMEYKLGSRLGTILIAKRRNKLELTEDGKLKTDKLKPDWKATKALWSQDPKAKEVKKLVFHTNKHTSGYFYSWFWDKRTSTAQNQYFYTFDASRWNTRLVPTAVNSGRLIDAYEIRTYGTKRKNSKDRENN